MDGIVRAPQYPPDRGPLSRRRSVSCGARFSRKMSLNENRSGMLWIADQRGSAGQIEPGADPGVVASDREVQFQARDRSERYVWIERVLGWCGSTWPDDGAEPGPGGPGRGPVCEEAVQPAICCSKQTFKLTRFGKPVFLSRIVGFASRARD